MKADAYKLDVILDEKQQWVVPVYQRHYEWETAADKQVPKLWEDLQDKAIEHLENRRPYPHYFGAILYSEPSGQPFGSIKKRFLVDGQQRITSFELILISIREVARDMEFDHVRDVVEAYIFNEKSKGMTDPKREIYKLWPSSYDRNLFQTIADNSRDEIRKLKPAYFYKNGKLIQGQAPNLLKAYWWLHESITNFIVERVSLGDKPEAVLDSVITGFLTGFQVVMIHLDENDDAQEIFASLNGMAKPLTPFDLIRNDVFHRARKLGEDDEELFDKQWKTFERPFWNELVRQGRFKRARADHLITHTVVAETAREVNAGKIASEYQHYARERAFPTIADELDVLLTHAETYREMEQFSNTTTNKLTKVLRIWDSTTFYPLVFWINAQEIQEQEKMALYDVIEAYLVRREVCGLTTKNYNKVAITMIRDLSEYGTEPQLLIERLVGLSGDASRMPTDAEVQDAVYTKRVYDSIPTPRIKYILQQIEHAVRTKFDEATVNSDDLTVEHILPRKWAEHWPLPSGYAAPSELVYDAISRGFNITDEVKAEMEKRRRLINTLGNLTLLTRSLNPSLSNGPWPKKQLALSKSLLALNRDISDALHWNEEEIQYRGKKMSEVFNRIWSIGET
jgi:hypothetical protein